MGIRVILLLLGVLLAAACSSSDLNRDAKTTASTTIRNIDEFNRAVANLVPGSRVTLANGTWSDVELRLKGEGTQEKPIVLEAEDAGKVVITGRSNLAFSGKHIVVSGLVFKNGFTPTRSVVSFRTAVDELANHSRLTNIVIDNFSNPERQEADTWVSIYGKNNRVDHNSFLNKRNKGVTVAVRMNTAESRENSHIIELNYFGPRQTLGSNGGETLRIGTSHYSREFSNTLVQRNYFDRTSGELEIISSKACGNTIRDNVFFESQGTLTMRHGHFTTVEGNYFLGNRKPNTGGIRIINENQTVKGNYIYGVTGHRFRGAMVIMNGVPDGPINRYDPVIDSSMNNNILIDSDHIQLCAGSDEERSGVPLGSEMHNNILMTKTNLDPVTIYDDVSGISFSGNFLNEEASVDINPGFKKVPYAVFENEFGLRSPSQTLLDEIGFGNVKLPISKAETGADYYPKVDAAVAFRTGKTIDVPPGVNTLLNALEASRPGDVLKLSNGGEYQLTKFARINHPLTIMAASGNKPVIRSRKSTFLVIENGGSLEIDNIWLDGRESPDLYGNSVVSTSRYSMNVNYSLIVRNSKITNLDKNHSFHFLRVYPSTFADYIEISETEMTNITGSVLSLDKEVEDLGIYNVENVLLKDNVFANVQGAVANIYRGGTDESTFGPIVTVSGNAFNNIGNGKRNKSGGSLLFHGVQSLEVSDSTWHQSAPLKLHLTNGEPITVVENIRLIDSGRIESNNDRYVARNVTYE